MGAPERLIFSSSVEALLKTASGKVSKDTDAKLRRMGMALDRKLEPAYPAANWARAAARGAVDEGGRGGDAARP
ncbi:MAG: DUF2378 family protein [Myxococcaceae bacterium]|jgi:uncharacterized protein (TIGR02265 family)|nr:DUF2378 family protein [Myxococcaceae bacterium]